MPGGSKHKYSKHSSRDTTEYSDLERDFMFRDRKGSVVKVSKDSSSGGKRKLDSKDGKDVNGSGNGEYSEEYGSSKRRNERSNDGVGDRWNSGEGDRGEGSRKLKISGESKSRRRDESLGVYGEGEELKKSSGKSDGKHKDSGRKESREGGEEKNRKFKEGRSERSADNEEQRMPKQMFENTDLRGLKELQSLELDNQLEKQMRKKRDDLGNGDKHQDEVGDGYDRHMSSRDDSTTDGRQKDDKRKDEKYRDKDREEMDRENKHRHDKQRDEHPAKDTSNRSDNKHGQEKDNVDSRQKGTKLLESGRDQDRDHNHNRDGYQDLGSSRDRERHHERVHAHDHDHDYNLDKDHHYNRDQNWDWDLDQDHDEDQDRDCDRDMSHAVEQSARSKESRAKKRNLEEQDDCSDTKSRVHKIHCSDAEKRSSNGVDSDADRGGSQSQQACADSIRTSSKQRSSPTSNTHIGKDEYRNVNSEDLKFRDSIMDMEVRTKGLREGLSGMSKIGARYKSTEKPAEIDDDPVGDLSNERSSSSKASPMGLEERSPSSTSIERKYVNRSGVRQNLEIEESGQRNSIDARDFSAYEDRLGRELTLEKSILDEFSQADSSFGRTSQVSASLIPPSHFRAGLDGPFMGSLEDDIRDNSNPQYRKNNDPGFGRWQGNSWRGVPNWTLPVPNGFVPFQHGPTHGGFQAMIPQFPSQALFGVRPPMEVNHAGIPYHIPDADRFSGHMRLLGWQNMMGTGPSRFHGWDSNNGVFRDTSHGVSDWDRNRHLTNSRGWDSGSETWKEQNCDLKKDLPSPAYKDESVLFQVDEVLTEPVSQMSQDDYTCGNVPEKAFQTKSSSFSSPEKVPMNSSPTIMPEKVPEMSTPSNNTSLFSQNYLSRLDISSELALPELHGQCMCLLDVVKNACIDSDASTDLFFKNGSRSRQKYAATLSKHSPFPVTDSSIFQRAIEHYKKQRVELPNGGKVDIFSVSNQLQVDEPVPAPSLEIMQVTVSTDDALANTPISTLDLKEVETLSPRAKEHLEEPHQNLSPRGQDHVSTHSVKLVISGASGDENQVSLAGGLGEEDEVTFKRVVTGGVEENHKKVVVNESKLESAMHKSGDVMNGKAIITGFAHGPEEKLGFGERWGGRLIFGDGTSKACDTLMPVSSESESLILSRIHHSPESTR